MKLAKARLRRELNRKPEPAEVLENCSKSVNQGYTRYYLNPTRIQIFVRKSRQQEWLHNGHFRRHERVRMNSKREQQYRFHWRHKIPAGALWVLNRLI